MSEIVTSTLATRLASGPLKDVILERLREGETPLAIATWLQDDLLEHVNDTREDLAHAIQTMFVALVPLEDRLDLIRNGRSAIARTVAKQKSQESTLDLMNKLVYLQMGRIEIGHDMEDTVGILQGSMSNEIEIARRLLRDKHEMEKTLGAGASGSGPKTGLSAKDREKIGRALMRLVEKETGESEIIDVTVVKGE